VMVGLLNGVLIAAVIGLIAAAWFQNIDLGYVIAAAMIVNMLAAALGGILIPLVLDRLGADPAISSSIFTTMITDVIGFLAFLSLASWWLHLG
jgi:magnesium transporter